MATYRKRGESWRAEISLHGVRESGTFKTKAAAVAWATFTENQIRTKEINAGFKHTLKDALIRYRDNISVTKRGVKWEQVRINAFIKNISFINKKIHLITSSDIATWRDQRIFSVMSSTVRRELSLLSSIFNYAQKEWRWCNENPVKGIILPKNSRARDRRITNKEIEKVIAALNYKIDTVPIALTHELALCFLLAIETAMRRGEILTLEWRNVFLAERYVHLSITKNGSSRDVPLSTEAVNILRLLHKKNGITTKVFELKNASADTMFRRVKARTEIIDLNFHDTRHEATTRLARKLNMLELARVTGHKDPRMLMIYYNETATELANKLD